MAIRRSSALLLLSSLLERVYGHLYMMTPVSRNFWGTTVFNDPTYEYINYCPTCYQSRGPAMVRDRAERLTDPAELALYGNGAWPHLVAYERGEIAANGNYLESDAISVRHGICGDPEQPSPEDSNRYGRANTNYPVLETYIEGTILEIKIIVGTPHKGHLEFSLCNTADMDDPDGVVNQGCFNMHPLDRAEDDGDASPIDPNHSGRYYLDPPCRVSETDQTVIDGVNSGYVVTGHYKLPSGVTCTRCILQMVYYTGNSCMHVGYDEFNPPSWPSECAPNKENWIKTGLGLCGDGNNYPEEYWNCADIEILPTGDPTSPSPVPAPVPGPFSGPETPAPYKDETAAPTNEETLSPIAMLTPAPINMETPAPEETPTPANGATLAPINEETPAPTNGNTPAPVNMETPAPTNEETSSPITMLTISPVNDETPAPVYEIPQPETLAPVDEICSENWHQCGGINWEGPTCCLEGAICLERSEWFSQCVPETRI